MSINAIRTFFLIMQFFSFLILVGSGNNEPFNFNAEGFARIIAEGIKDGLGQQIADGIKQGSQTIKLEIDMDGFWKDFAKSSDGMGYAADSWGRNIGYNFGEGSIFSDNLSEVSQNLGRNFGEVIDGIGDHLYPFVLKYGITTAIALCCIATGYYGTKTFYRILEHKFTNPKPKILLTSSKDVPWRTRLWWKIVGKPIAPKMIFNKTLENRLQELIQATKKINALIRNGRKNIKYNNILLYGPPGTGKTMFAKRLAEESNMDFVITTGPSFFQPNAGVAAVKELFDWAKKSKRCLCIFIDEADSLFVSRDQLRADDCQIINEFLANTPEASDRFMLVIATNRPIVFDEAMQRRITVSVEMPLPEENERFATLCHYRDTILKDKQNSKQFIEAIDTVLDDDKIREIAQKTEQFSYADLANIINTIFAQSIITENSLPNSALIDEQVAYALEKKHKTFSSQQ